MSWVKKLWAKWGSPISGRDRYSVLSPATFVARILGFFPFLLDGPVGRKKYSMRYALLMYSMAIHVVVLAGVLAWVRGRITGSIFVSPSQLLLNITVITELVLPLSSVILLCASIVLTKEKWAKTINNLCAQDEALRNLGIQIDYAADFRRSCIRLGIIISIIFVFFTVDLFLNLENNLRNPVIWILWIVSNLDRIMCTCFFVDGIVIFMQKLSLLNRRLRKIIEESRKSPFETISMRLRTCKQLRSMTEIHRNLCNSASSWNQIFGLSIVIEVVSFIFTLTMSLYRIVEEITATEPNHDVFSIVNLAIMSSIQLVYVTMVCHMAQNKTNLTGRLIHMLNIPKPDSMLDSAIKSFSIQLHDGKLEFFAAGLFPIDATLLKSILGAVIAYVVVAIQLRNTTKL